MLRHIDNRFLRTQSTLGTVDYVSWHCLPAFSDYDYDLSVVANIISICINLVCLCCFGKNFGENDQIYFTHYNSLYGKVVYHLFR